MWLVGHTAAGVAGHNEGKGSVNGNGNIMRRSILLLSLLAVSALEANVQAQSGHLITSWPAFSYDGKPALKDGSFAVTTVAGSQLETSQYRAVSKTMTAADGRLQIRLDSKTTRTSRWKNTPSS